MKKIKKIVLFIVVLAFSLFALTVIINLPVFDEKLLPEVVAIKNLKAKPYSENNAHPALLAINNAGDDLLVSTAQIRRILNQKIAETGLDFFDNEEYDRYINSEIDKEWQHRYKSCNSRRESTCLTSLVEELQDHPITDPRLQAQLKKYQQLLMFSDFSDSVLLDFQAPIIPYGAVMKLKRLHLALSYNEEAFHEFFNVIDQDLQFWQMLLEKGHLMITKMVAIASVHDSISAVSAAVRTKQLDQNQLMALQNQWDVFSISSLNMKAVFDAEFRAGINMFAEAEQSGEFRYLNLVDFFQLNATHNLAYTLTAEVRNLAKLNAAEFYTLKDSERFKNDAEHVFTLSPSSFYNPTGKMLLSYSILPYTDYIARIHDLNGMIHLLKLQIELAMYADRPKKAVIAQSKYVNPYTLEAMNYNEETNSIYFECMDKTSDCELAL
ncbi:MAG: hypothetical protein KDI92_01240 [Xanthomonadales bacterium]|nr:hypothetical protein [Xanthomonadales bacterium]